MGWLFTVGGMKRGWLYTVYAMKRGWLHTGDEEGLVVHF